MAISQLRPGAQVLATNPQTGSTQPETVQAVMVNHDTDLMDVVVDTAEGEGTIDSTAHHLFWDLTTRAWTQADQLPSGDKLWTPDGQLAMVARLLTVPGSQEMWDLTVANDHDFYVVTVDTAVLVHNCPIPSGQPDVNGPLGQMLMNGPSESFAGAGSSTELRLAQELANSYGGDPYAWAHMTSAVEGLSTQVHWFENLETGLRVAPKFVNW